MTTRRALLLGCGTLGLERERSFGLAKIRSRFGGIEVGLESFCFHDLPLDKMLDTAVELDFGSVELSLGHLEPLKADRETLRRWRLGGDWAPVGEVRRKIEGRGITLRSLAAGVWPDWTDGEIDGLFQIARALGVDLITSSNNVSGAARLEPFAKRYHIRVGFHNHSTVEPDDLATEEDFDKVLAGRSELLGITLDTGHYTAAGFDPVALLRRRHRRIFLLHLKDRKKDQGPQVNFGEGDTPLKEILLMLKHEKWDIPCMVEHVVQSGDIVDAVRQDYEWTRRVLEA